MPNLTKPFCVVQLAPDGKGLYALVSDRGYKLVKDHTWKALKKDDTWYAYTRINGHTVLMHHLIVGYPPRNMTVDHVNHNGLDNREFNLRFATHSQQKANSRKQKTFEGKKTSSVFKGVSKLPSGKWKAQIRVNGEQLYLGCYKTEQEAADRYNEEAVSAFGRYSLLN
jgi:HNH endonuclease